MKFILILSAVLLLFTVPAFSALTVEDIEKIRSIIKEEITAVKKETIASETRVKEYVSQEIAKVNIKIEEMDRRLTGEIRSLDKQLDRLFALVMVLVAFVAVVIGIPQIIVAMQRKDIRAQDAKIEALQQEIETRRQERIVRP